MKSKSIFVLKIFTIEKPETNYCINSYSGNIYEDDELEDNIKYEKEIGHFSSIRKALKYAFEKKFAPEDIRIYEYEIDNPKSSRRLFKLSYPSGCTSLLGKTSWEDEYSSDHHVKWCECRIKKDGSIYTYYYFCGFRI